MSDPLPTPPTYVPHDAPIGPHLTRVGIFKKKNPMKPGNLWSWGQWLAFFGWLGLVVASIARAWSKVGGLPRPVPSAAVLQPGGVAKW